MTSSTTPDDDASRRAVNAAATTVRAPSREVDVRDLMGDAREVTLLHAGQRYALRITSNNRLILTK